MIINIKGSIYYPDILGGATMLSDKTNGRSFYKDPLDSEDVNIQYKTKVFLGINKLIELANIFECVYLDKIEFFFVIKDFYRMQPLVCIELLTTGKISFIDADKFYMFYCIDKDDNPLQLYSLPKVSNDELINSFSEFDNNELIMGLNFAIKKSIKSRTVDGKMVTMQCSNDIRNGYYQELAIGMNHFININEDNKELYDLIAQLSLNRFICNLYEIDSIYLEPYFYCADKCRCLFLNGISQKRSRIHNETIPNITYSAASNSGSILSNRELLSKSNGSCKTINVISYNNFDGLKEAYSCEITDDYKSDAINFVDSNGVIQTLIFIQFEKYRNDLEKQGRALRTTKSFIKIVPKEYISDFILGNIKFSRPILFAKSDGTIGQNDLTEGTYKSEIVDGKRRFYRNVYDLNNTYICCFYGLDNYMFVKSKTDKSITYSAIIKKEFFQGFFSESNKGEYAVVFIKPNEFVDRLVDSLVKGGIKKEDIVISPVIYIRKDEDFCLSCEEPMELFYKDIFYLSQNEIRVLIKNPEGKYDCLFNKSGVINIGRIDDICHVFEWDFKSDMKCTQVSENRIIVSS